MSKHLTWLLVLAVVLLPQVGHTESKSQVALQSCGSVLLAASDITYIGQSGASIADTTVGFYVPSSESFSFYVLLTDANDGTTNVDFNVEVCSGPQTDCDALTDYEQYTQSVMYPADGAATADYNITDETAHTFSIHPALTIYLRIAAEMKTADADITMKYCFNAQ